MQTNASDYRLGAAILQEHESVLRPGAFACHTLTGAERKYSTTERECLVIIFGLKMLNMYLVGALCCIQKDHMALSWRSQGF